MGAAYKKNVDDYRESPSLKIIKNLSKSYKIDYFDPHISNIKIDLKKYFSIKNFNYLKLKKYSAVVIVTDVTFVLEVTTVATPPVPSPRIAILAVVALV